jgi:hypothetical protein
MTYEKYKAKYPNLNWAEAEEQDQENLEAAAMLWDRIVAEARAE